MKYKLTDETMIHNGITLYRIECIEAFSTIIVGDKGGWIEKKSNLSQGGNAWIYDDAKVYGNARVCGNVCVCNNAEVYGNAKVYYNAEVSGNAKVYDNAEVHGNAEVYGNAKVYNNARVYDNAEVYDSAKIYDNAIICGNAEVCGDAEVESINDYMIFKNSWSSGRHFTWTRSNNMWKVGCFYGTGEELIKKAYAESQQKGDCYKAVVDFVENIYKFIKKVQENPEIFSFGDELHKKVQNNLQI